MPYIVSFFLFTLVMGFFMHMAFKNGEVKFKCTKEELGKLSTRGRTIHFVAWPFVGLGMVGVINWMSNDIQRGNMVVFFFVMLAAGIPAGLLAWAVNEFLERTRFRIQKSVPR